MLSPSWPQLGVLAPEDAAEAEEYSRRRDGGGASSGGGARGAGAGRGPPHPRPGPPAAGGIDHKFSLGDEEEGGTPPAPAAARAGACFGAGA